MRVRCGCRCIGVLWVVCVLLLCVLLWRMLRLLLLLCVGRQNILRV